MPTPNYSAEALQRLCTDGAQESATLEFKRELPGRSEKDRMEFLKDVTALANAGGGEIIYGIAEGNGSASAITPITNENFDEVQRRLAQSALASIEPPILGLQFEEVQVDEGWCLVVKVPASYSSPHRYGTGGAFRFVLRERGFVRDMSYTELRAAFTRVGEARAEARRFREQRVDAIRQGRTWREMAQEPLCVVHVIPLSAYASANGLDLTKAQENWSTFIQGDWGGGSRTFNLDGLVVYPGGSPPLHAYLQIYRDGTFEGVFTAGHWSYENMIPSVAVANCMRQTVFASFAELARQGLTGPTLIYVSLLNVKDHQLGVGSSYPSLRPLKSDRDNLLLPDILVESSEKTEQTEQALRRVMDVIWQCFGSSSCSFYDKEGRWAPPR